MVYSINTSKKYFDFFHTLSLIILYVIKHFTSLTLLLLRRDFKVTGKEQFNL